MWGLITVLVDSLIPRLKEIFSIGNFEAGLVQFAFFIAYGFVSIPAGLLLKKIGYKKGIIIGLLTMGIGCLMFYPAASFRVFPLFLLGYFTLASGMTVLQVAANPYVTMLGDSDGASSRLNLSQAFNSLGTAIAPVIGAIFILSDNILSTDEIVVLTENEKIAYYLQEASAVQGPFIILAAMLIGLAIFVFFTKLPKVLNENSVGTYAEVIKNKLLSRGALGIFVYVGVEVAIGSYLTLYFMDMGLVDQIKSSELMGSIFSLVHSSDITEVDGKAVVGAFVVFYWSGAMVGRSIGTYLTKMYNPGSILSLFSLGAVLMVLLSMNTTGFIAMWSIIAVGLFNSIMFPTIFAIAISGLGDLKPLGSGVLCTAICGGAFISPFYGYLADTIGFKLAFILPIVCYGYIYYYGKLSKKIINNEG
jgi:MFS transporter, FHS family, L-fucose permease